MIRRPPRSSLYLYTTLFRFFFNDPATTEIYTLSLHDALPIYPLRLAGVYTVADGVAAHDGSGQVDDEGERGAQRIEAEEGAAERQPDGDLDGFEPGRRREQREQRHARQSRTDSCAGCVDEARAERAARGENPEHREREQQSDAAGRQLAHHHLPLRDDSLRIIAGKKKPRSVGGASGSASSFDDRVVRCQLVRSAPFGFS